MNFNQVCYLRIFRKSVAKKQVSLKYEKNNGCLIWRRMYIICCTSQLFLGSEAFQAKVVQNRNTRVLGSVYFFFFLEIVPLMR